MKRGFVSTVLLVLVMACSPLAGAYDDVGLNHVATTYADTKDSPWQVAEVACCHCVSYLSNGQRFYHGVIPIQNCVGPQIKGHCEGEAKCFQ